MEFLRFQPRLKNPKLCAIELWYSEMPRSTARWHAALPHRCWCGLVRRVLQALRVVAAGLPVTLGSALLRAAGLRRRATVRAPPSLLRGVARLPRPRSELILAWPRCCVLQAVTMAPVEATRPAAVRPRSRRLWLPLRAPRVVIACWLRRVRRVQALRGLFVALTRLKCAPVLAPYDPVRPPACCLQHSRLRLGSVRPAARRDWRVRVEPRAPFARCLVLARRWRRVLLAQRAFPP